MSKVGLYLQRNWLKYAVVAVAIALLWYVVFLFVTNPKKTEKIEITFVGQRLSVEKFERDIEGVLSLEQSPVKKVSVETVLAGDDYMFSMLMATRLLSKDIVIVQEDLLASFSATDYFAEIPTEKAQERFENAIFYTENGNIYGLELDASVCFNFAKYYEGEKKCYLFFSSNSHNVGNLFGKQGLTTDNALAIASYLMEK